jgi:hypothetical protein
MPSTGGWIIPIPDKDPEVKMAIKMYAVKEGKTIRAVAAEALRYYVDNVISVRMRD